jgi:DNA-binding CsgD family transcriptional regulator
MTLHTAIEKLLQQTGRQMTTHEIADSLNLKSPTFKFTVGRNFLIVMV